MSRLDPEEGYGLAADARYAPDLRYVLTKSASRQMIVKLASVTQLHIKALL